MIRNPPGNILSIMSVSANYTVRFGQIARTLVYEDSIGNLLFTFDVGPAEEASGGSWNLYLSKQALIEANGNHQLYVADSVFERDRIATALDKVRQYCASRGYVVSVE